MGAQADAIRAALLRGVRQARNDTIVEVTANLREPPDEGGTPVDSGWARANWLASIGAPVTETAGSEDAVSSAETAQREGLVAVATYAGPEPVYVSNNVPYIARLNDGWSKQAPSRFVDRAVAKAEATMQKLHDTEQVDIAKPNATLPKPPGAP